jgi:hypothetical protein
MGLYDERAAHHLLAGMEAALIAAQAFAWVLLPASVGLLDGYLLSMGWYGLLGFFVVAVILAAILPRRVV